MRGGRGILVALVVLLLMPPALAQEEEPAEETIRAEVLEIRPGPDAAVMVGGRRYAGTIRVSGHSTGLAVVETVPLDRYLAGIQEVPFSWEPAALRAQAIAARTYLAWNLNRGRTDSGRRYDYDICATDACQVYAGLEPTLGEGGDRWLEAVTSTDSQILLYDGEPAVTYYSSTTGGRTRTVTDIWPDIDLPYLQAVDSPGEDSPFAEWSWRLPSRVMASLFEEAGLAGGRLGEVSTTTTEDGGGPWTVEVTSDAGTEIVDTWSLRGILNRAGPAVAPSLLPSLRGDGKRYPQSILSPTYTISTVRLPVPGPGVVTSYQIDGRGWGHLVGMSQYGAQAMAEEGASAAEILDHFYTGLDLVESPEFAPETVEVALVTESADLALEVTGPVSVSVDGRQVAADELASWQMTADSGAIEVRTPVGLGLPPRLHPGTIGFASGRLVLQPELTAAATVTWQLAVDDVPVASFGPEPVDAGFIPIPWPTHAETVSLTIEAHNAHGGQTITFEYPPDSGAAEDG
jgi:stage II sporulation protein D